MVSKKGCHWINGVGSGQESKVQPPSISNDDKPKRGGGKSKSIDRAVSNQIEGGSSVNSICFNQCQSDNYFITVDDASNFRMWDSKKGTLLHEET